MAPIFFVLLFALVGGSKGSDPIDNFTWLQGTWEMKKKDGSSRLEIWKYKDENTLSGRGLITMKTDTSTLESLEIVFRDDHFWYIPVVADQNDGQPIPFKLIKQKGFDFTFENPDHDFPQRIVYKLLPLYQGLDYRSMSGDTLKVRVEDLSGDGIGFTFLRK